VVDGKSYHFVLPATFSILVFRDASVDHTNFGERQYGTSKTTIPDAPITPCNIASSYKHTKIQTTTMPPIRPETSQKLAYQEDKILLALDDIKNGRIKSLRAARRLYEVSSTIPHERASGLPSRVDSRLTSHKLTPLIGRAFAYWVELFYGFKWSTPLARTGNGYYPTGCAW
jgi:hypothetical protein